MAAVVTAGAVVAGSWYVGRTTSDAADVVSQSPASAGSPVGQAETRACVIGFGLALDAGLAWDSNTALEDADELEALLDQLSDKQIRAAAEELARQIPRLVGMPEYEADETGELSPAATNDPTEPPADDPTELITELLWDLRNECDNRFL